MLCSTSALPGTPKPEPPSEGIASWYGEELRGELMANGKPFNPDKLTCASWNYPLGTKLRVSHKNKSVTVEVTDRGPNKRLGRLIDLSQKAFSVLSDTRKGLIPVGVQLATP